MKNQRTWSAVVVVALVALCAALWYAPVKAQDVPAAGGNGTVWGNVSWDISNDHSHTNNEPNFDGLEVRVYNQDTGVLVATNLMQDNDYKASNLPDGRYRIEADSPSEAFVINSSNLEFEIHENGSVKVDLPFRLDRQKAIDLCRSGKLPTWGRDGQFGTWQAPGKYAPYQLGEGWDEVCNLFPKSFKQVHIVVQTFTGERCDDSIYVSFKDDIWNGELQMGMESNEMGFFEVEDQKEFYNVMRPGDVDLWAYDSGMHDCEPSIPVWPTCKSLLEAPASRLFSDQGADRSPFNVASGSGQPGEDNARSGIRDLVARVDPNTAATLDAVQCLVIEPCTAIRTRWYAGDRPGEAFLMAEHYDTAFSKPWRGSNVWEDGQLWDLPWDGKYIFANNEENLCPVTPTPTPTPVVPTPTPTPTPKPAFLVITKVVMQDGQPRNGVGPFTLKVAEQGQNKLIASNALRSGMGVQIQVPPGIKICISEADVDPQKWEVNIVQTSGDSGTAAASFPVTGPEVCGIALQAGESQNWSVINTAKPVTPPQAPGKVYLPAISRGPRCNNALAVTYTPSGAFSPLTVRVPGGTDGGVIFTAWQTPVKIAFSGSGQWLIAKPGEQYWPMGNLSSREFNIPGEVVDFNGNTHEIEIGVAYQVEAHQSDPTCSAIVEIRSDP